MRYMEKSMATLMSNATKNKKRTKVDLKKRTQENTQLIYDLNLLRGENKQLEEEKKNLLEQVCFAFLFYF